MVKRVSRHKLKALKDSPHVQKASLPILIISCGIVVMVTIWSLVAMPTRSPGTKNGVGADGFHAYIEDGSDLGAKAIVDKAQVITALGDRAKSVGNADVSQVFNLNDDKSQTLTFSFVRNDGVAAHLYVDKKQYKSLKSLENDHIYAATATAGEINGRPAYYRLAQTVDNDREYHIMVVDGTTVYRFVIAQPLTKITIDEVDAAAILKKLALQSKL